MRNCAYALRSLMLGAALLAIATPAGAAEWLTYGGTTARHFFNPDESLITKDNIAARLGVKWTFPTEAIVTAAPGVATVDVPGEGETQVAYIQSWDGNMYALRVSDGSELWRFATEPHPGASYPNVGSVHIEEVAGEARVFFGAGEILYCLDAVTGDEVWRFYAGTDCVNGPGLCDFSGERNEIETSPLVVDGMVVFGMDVNDRETGKGGVYAVDLLDGRMEWYFDVETGSTCTPDPGDDIRRFDGYHSESELALPATFLSTRSGCDFDRSPTGCGNVWASPAVDEVRQLLYFASSNCDTDLDPVTNRPEPPMAPHNEALFALNYDGTSAWLWRPRPFEDNADLAFGATPQLFTIDVTGVGTVDVVGIGNKDGNYYVIDRDGVNEDTGVAWDDPSVFPDDLADDPSTLPYWIADLVPGGSVGGIIGTPAVDDTTGRIYASTAPGFGDLATLFNPQRPTVHAMDMDTGAVVWQNTTEEDADASFAPTSAIPGVVFAGAVLPPGKLRFYDSDTGEKLGFREVGSAIACAATVVDGTLLIGGGVGEIGPNPDGSATQSAGIDNDVTAFCVLGAPGCPARLTGKKLQVKDAVDAAKKRKINWQTKDKENSVSPDPGTAEDPTVGGAALTLTNPASSETQTIPLPASAWVGLGKPAGTKGYKYKDSKLLLGPCKQVQVKPGKQVKASCKGEGITFTLDEATQGSLAVSLALGVAGDWRYCSLHGGAVSKDFGTVTNGKKGEFKSKNADRPVISDCQ